MNIETQKANDRLALEAWLHLSKTRVKSITDDGEDCLYSGSGCAFSPAIFSSQVDKIWQERTAERLIKETPDVLHEWARNCGLDFANKVQDAHDYAVEGDKFLESFAFSLLTECKEFNVAIPDGLEDYLESKKS